MFKEHPSGIERSHKSSLEIKDLNLQMTKVKSVIFHPTCVDATHFKLHWISRFTIPLVFATFFLVRLRKKEAVMRVVTLR